MIVDQIHVRAEWASNDVLHAQQLDNQKQQNKIAFEIAFVLVSLLFCPEGLGEKMRYEQRIDKRLTSQPKQAHGSESRAASKIALYSPRSSSWSTTIPCLWFWLSLLGAERKDASSWRGLTAKSGAEPQGCWESHVLCSFHWCYWGSPNIELLHWIGSQPCSLELCLCVEVPGYIYCGVCGLRYTRWIVRHLFLVRSYSVGNRR